MPELDLDLWLQPADVEPEATLVFIDEGKHGVIKKTPPEEDTKTFEIGVKLPDGSTRLWTMNLTSQRAVSQAYSTNTISWINKPVTVYTSRQNVRGVEKKVIYARVPAK